MLNRSACGLQPACPEGCTERCTCGLKPARQMDVASEQRVARVDRARSIKNDRIRCPGASSGINLARLLRESSQLSRKNAGSLASSMDRSTHTDVAQTLP